MNYKDDHSEGIQKTMNPEKGPFVGPALCDMVQGDASHRIPDDMGNFYIPEFKKAMSFADRDYPFFCELQPEIPWVRADGGTNGDNPWLKLGDLSGHRFGMHLPISWSQVSPSNPCDAKKVMQNRALSIDFGQRIGVEYYVLHVSHDECLGNQNDESLKDILKHTVDYLDKKGTRAYLLLENLEYPKYPSTPQELYWWYHKVKEMVQGSSLKLGIMLDVSHLWRTRGEIIRALREGRGVPDWIVLEKDILHQPYHDFLNYTLKTRLSDITVAGFHVGGCYGDQTHLIPGMRLGDDPENTPLEINRFYDENVEMNMKTTLKIIVQYYFDSYRTAEDPAREFRPLYIVTESYISFHHHTTHALSYPSILKGTRAVRDYILKYCRKLLDKSQNRVRIFNLLSSE